jgi:hypothetical protein
VCYEQAFRMETQLLGDRTLRLNIANAKTLCWTRVYASSMQFTLSKPADIEYILIISFRYPLFFQLAVLSMFFILYAYSFVTSFVVLCQLSKFRIPTLCPARYSPVPQHFSDHLDQKQVYHIPQDQHQHVYRRENLKSHTVYLPVSNTLIIPFSFPEEYQGLRTPGRQVQVCELHCAKYHTRGASTAKAIVSQ